MTTQQIITNEIQFSIGGLILCEFISVDFFPWVFPWGGGGEEEGYWEKLETKIEHQQPLKTVQQMSFRENNLYSIMPQKGKRKQANLLDCVGPFHDPGLKIENSNRWTIDYQKNRGK